MFFRRLTPIAALAACTYGQPQPPASRIAPLGSYGHVLSVLSFAGLRADFEQARALEMRNERIQAINAYRRLIRSLEALNPRGYDASVLLAAAHLDAARVLEGYEPQLKNLGRDAVMQNRSEVIQHAQQAVIEAVNAYNALPPGPERSRYVCEAKRLAGESVFLQGVVEDNHDQMLSAIKFYKFVLNCDPASKARTGRTIRYIETKGHEKGIESAVGVTAQFLSVAVEGSKIYEMALNAAYSYWKEHRTSPFGP